jgi:transposase-like protein
LRCGGHELRDEVGEELLTIYCLLKTQWKSLRTTNVIERVNEDLRRRVKTQGPHPCEEAVLNVTFG